MSDHDSGRLRPRQYPGVGTEPARQVRLAGEQQTRRLGQYLGDHSEAGDYIGLVGELGAGKTTLVQGLIQGVAPGTGQRATSPTYALVQVYETNPPIYHMDLYRLEGFADLESVGYWDIVDAGRGVCCVEWMDRIPDAWPGRGLIVELIGTGSERTARLFADDRWRQRLVDFETFSLDLEKEKT